MPDAYWQRQISRRTALRSAAAASGAGAALSLVGCDGNEDSGGGGRASTDVKSVDSTQGKPGGTFTWVITGFPASFAPRFTRWWELGGLTHSGLLAHKWGVQSVAEDDWFNMEGDVAQSLPEQPDNLTFVFKVRPGIKFHNGRAMTAEDVRYSLDYLMNNNESVYRERWRTWVDRIDATDASTVTVKAKFPYADGLLSLGVREDGFILAKEFQESEAANRGLMGSGPWTFVDATPPVSANFKKNPEYYDKPYPYFDNVRMVTYTDPSKRAADYAAGQLQLPWLVYALEREEIKKLRPDGVYQNVPQSALMLYMRTDKAPFNDKRVRQAMSMAIDRKKIREATTVGEGEPDQFLNLAYEKIFASKAVKDLGASAKYWDFNPAEAKKLLAAAGITGPIDGINLYHAGAGSIGPIAPDTATLTTASFKDGGIINPSQIEQTPAQTSSTTGVGNYDGMGINTTSGMSSAPALALALHSALYTSPAGEIQGSANRGHINDPRLNGLVERQLREPKLEDRQKTYREIEAILAEEQYNIMYSTTLQTWFMDPKLVNYRMPPTPLTSRRFWARWWFA